MDGYAMPQPPSVIIGKHTLHRVAQDRPYGLFFRTKQPKVLIGIEAIVPYFQRKTVRDGIILDFVGEIIFLVFTP
jgi:hypothetical protein